MKRFGPALAVIVLLGTRAVAGGEAAVGVELPLTRVLLSSGGVGQMERQAVLDSSAQTPLVTLSVPRTQVDDILKSLLVEDSAKSRTTSPFTLSLPGEKGLAEILHDLAVPPETLESPLALLQAVKGTAVSLITETRTLSGLLLAVRELPAATGADPQSSAPVQADYRISVLGPHGIEEVRLDSLRQIRLEDPGLQARLSAALAAHASRINPDRHRLTLHLPAVVPASMPEPPPGPRRIRVSYVIEAPVWKSAYRLVLEAAAGRLQGWAILENRSGEDWENITLAITSDAPVTFRQALYPAYTPPRPEVSLAGEGSLLPPPDSGSLPLAAPPPPAPAAAPLPAAKARAAEAPPSPPVRQALPAVDGKSPPAGGSGAERAAGGASTGPDETAAAENSGTDGFADQSAESPGVTGMRVEAATGTAAFTYFHPLPVTLAEGRTLAIPLVDQTIPAQPVALYQPQTHARHPLAAIRLENRTGTALPAGVLALYSRPSETLAEGVGVSSLPAAPVFAGDIQFPFIPAGEERLLSFALDPRITVVRSESRSRTLVKVQALEGLLHLTRHDEQSTAYTIQNAGPAKPLILEHPEQAGWELLPDPAVTAASRNGSHWRLTLPLAAHAVTRHTVRVQRPLFEQISLDSLTPERLMALIAGVSLPETARQEIASLAAAQRAVRDAEQALSRLQQEQSVLSQDQERLRANLETVSKTTPLGKRYLAKLGEQEKRFENLEAGIAQAQNALDTARQTLRARIQSFRL